MIRTESKKTLGLIAVAIPVLALFTYVVLRSGPLAPVPVTTAVVSPRELMPEIAGVGVVEARYSHRVGPLAAGRLTRVSVQPGDAVVVGQVLAAIDPIDLDQRLASLVAMADQAAANLQELEARRDFAAGQVQRYDRLFASQLVSEETATGKRQELRIAMAALAAGRKELARIRSDHDAIARQRESLLLRSPVAGIVAARSADPGTTVVAGQSVVEIIEPGEVWINARFDQIGANGLRAGLDTVIELRSRDGEFFQGQVARVEPKADAVTEETLAKISFRERLVPLPPLGEIVQLTVRLPARPAAQSIPAAALRRVGHDIGVWKVADGEIEFVPARTGAVDQSGYVEVLAGLQNGDRIVLYSGSNLSAQSRIQQVADRQDLVP